MMRIDVMRADNKGGGSRDCLLFVVYSELDERSWEMFI